MTMREYFIYKKKAQTMRGNYRRSTNNHFSPLTHRFSSLTSKTTNYDNLGLFFGGGGGDSTHTFPGEQKPASCL